MPSPALLHPSRRKDVLANGLPVVTVELPHLHTCSLVMYSRVGSRYESRDDNGLSHFLEHMLFRGTAEHPDAHRINGAIEELGGTLYAETGRDYSLYQLSLSPETVPEGVALLGEIFRGPVFEGIEIERRIILEEILEDLDEEGRGINVDDVTRAIAFAGHPLGQTITGPYQNVERFTVDDARRHFTRGYGARNMVFAASGAVDHARVMAAAERSFAALPPGELLTFAPPGDPAGPARFAYVPNQGSQTSVQILFRATSELSPEFAAQQMLARILDDGMSTRLHHRVCDELGLAYYVSGAIDSYIDVGLYEIDATCGHESVPALTEEALRLLARLREEPPRAAELEKAKRRYRWDLLASLDDPDAMAAWWAGAELFFPPVDFDEKLARIDAVTPEQVSSLAARIFRPERLVVAAVGMLEGDLERAVADVVAAFR
jgi:predicted Zn-dependent peptidase